MSGFISSLILLEGWKRLAAAFLAGLLGAFAQVPFAIVPLMAISLPVLIWLLDSAALGKLGRESARAMLCVGWAFGFGFFLVTFYWLGEAFLVEAEKFAFLMPLAVLVLPALLALFWGLACALLSLVWSGHWTRIIWLALAFSAAEWLRATLFTGLPWGGFGSALTSYDITLQALAIGGLHLLTFFALLLFAVPVLLVEPSGKARRAAFLLLGLFGLMLIYGGLRLSNADKTQLADTGPVVRIVQPNIAQREKWKLENRSWIFNRLLALSSQSSDEHLLDEVDLIIWPESAVPFYLMDQPAALAAIAQILPDGTELATGALRPELRVNGTGSDVYNSIYRIADDGTLAASYDKTHLVPFGEYLPFQSLLESMGLTQLTNLKGGFAEGRKRALMDFGKAGKAIPLICYEVAFASEIGGFKSQPNWILNTTNDAWFGTSIGPYQHLQISQMRAVELGIPLVRAANTGVSAMIDSYGRISQFLPIETSGIIQMKMPPMVEYTVYSQLKDWLFLTIWGLVFGVLSFLARKKQAASPVN